MNTDYQKESAAQENNHLIKEDRMATKKSPKRLKRGDRFAVLTAGFLILVLGLIAQPLLAQPGGSFGPRNSPDEIVQLLTDRLDLTEEQAEEIRPIMEDKSTKMKELREKRGTDRQAFRTEMQKLRWTTEQKLGDILTEDQVGKYLEFRQEQRNRKQKGKFRGSRMGRGFNKTPEQIIERMTYRLDLNEDQAAAVRPIIEESIEKRKEVFDHYRDQGAEGKQSMRDEMQAIGDDTEAQLSGVLTDEQMEKLRTFREKRQARADKMMNRPRPVTY